MQVKKTIREALQQINQADENLESIRDHYNLEWGENSYCDLDLALKHAQEKLAEAHKELDDVLIRFRGRGVALDWPKGRSWV